MTAELSYRAAIDLLLSLADFERKSRAGEPPDFHIRRMTELLRLLGDPHLAVPAVHVAGSKGKGSTAAMIAWALAAHGFKVGLYTSPHLHTFCERIRLAQRGLPPRPVSQETFAALVARQWPYIEAIADDGRHGRVTVFEMLTAMAFDYFKRVDAEVQVIEVGLGGRLDATNLVQPAVSVITPISLDHTAVLGETIAQIAAEKAGIIKPGVPVVSGRQPPEAMEVIQQVAYERGSESIRALETIASDDLVSSGVGPQCVSLSGPFGRCRVSLPLLGKHQVDNVRTAVAALCVLRSRGFKIEPQLAAAGLSAVEWPARAQVLQLDGVPLLVDGAHNPASAAALVETVKRHFPARGPTMIILGGTAGHDFSATARQLAVLNADVIITGARHPRAIPAERLAASLASQSTEGRRDKVRITAVAADTTGALAEARQRLVSGGLVIATGSLFVAAEVVEAVTGIEPELYPDLKGSFTQPYKV